MKVIAIAAIAAAAGLATASPIMSTTLTEYTVDNAGTPTASMVIDISGINSWDSQGSLNNHIMSILIGTGAEVTGIAWDVFLSAGPANGGASWASEAVMGIEGQINLSVGAGTDAPTTNMNFNSGGVVDITDAGLPNITVGADGILDIEFFESFDDEADAIDNVFEAGSTITLVGTNFVPTPGSLAVLGLGGLVAGRRRR